MTHYLSKMLLVLPVVTTTIIGVQPVGLAGISFLPGEGEPAWDATTQISATSTPVNETVKVPHPVSSPELDFDRFTDEQSAVKILDSLCGLTTRPCHTPVAVYETRQPTLRQLVIEYFDPADWGWAIRVAFCESSAQPGDWYSDAVAGSSGATGWFQHLPQYWDDRSSKAGFSGFPPNHPVANVGVAAWLLYNTPQGRGHWWPSEHCWEEQQ